MKRCDRKEETQKKKRQKKDKKKATEKNDEQKGDPRFSIDRMDSRAKWTFFFCFFVFAILCFDGENGQGVASDRVKRRESESQSCKRACREPAESLKRVGRESQQSLNRNSES